MAAGPAVTAFLRSAEVVHNDWSDRDGLRAEVPEFAVVLERYEWLLDEMRLLPFRLMISRAVDQLAEGGGLASQVHVAHVLVDESSTWVAPSLRSRSPRSADDVVTATALAPPRAASWIVMIPMPSAVPRTAPSSTRGSPLPATPA